MIRKEDMEKNEEPMSLVLSISRDVVLVAPPPLTVLLPLTAYHDGTVLPLVIIRLLQFQTLTPMFTEISILTFFPNHLSLKPYHSS